MKCRETVSLGSSIVLDHLFSWPISITYPAKVFFLLRNLELVLFSQRNGYGKASHDWTTQRIISGSNSMFVCTLHIEITTSTLVKKPLHPLVDSGC